MDELKKAREMVEELGSICLHYLGSHTPLTTPPETAITKGRRKTNSTKRDKSHWEYVSVTHRKIGKSSGSGSRSGSGSGSGPSPSLRGRERVIELIRRTNWEEGSAPADYWMDTPDHLYVIANTFNLCIIFLARLGSTTVLPLVSNMDGNAGTIFISFIEEQQHFIQLPVSESHWEYSRDSVSSGGCGGGTNPCNHPCRNSVEWQEHWSMSLSISAKMPRAIVPPQKYSSTRTSCCMTVCVPLEAG
ncbi:hypothetical protein M9H77_19021 [Catharanthus roseus]|uniref:Uncharacterized protein n=1 Tax=Catharanthus roseus TaxID=4058 RepID=A0ACC0B977_CATRO|nr:hypothetical protein M9H77_19021 [Catharanthus roseus]